MRTGAHLQVHLSILLSLVNSVEYLLMSCSWYYALHQVLAHHPSTSPAGA